MPFYRNTDIPSYRVTGYLLYYEKCHRIHYVSLIFNYPSFIALTSIDSIVDVRRLWFLFEFDLFYKYERNISLR